MTAQPSLMEAVEFAENPEPRCPCVLLLDTSASMKGRKIEALNAGMETFHDALLADPVARRRVEVGIIGFDSEIEVVQGFATAPAFEAPILVAKGQTRMGSGILRALDLIEERKRQYRRNGVSYYRPWLYLLTDGAPQGEPTEIFERAGAALREAEAASRLAFFAVGVEGANMDTLRGLSARAPVRLKGLDFAAMFTWLSASVQAVAQSRPEEQVALPPPGWAAI